MAENGKYRKNAANIGRFPQFISSDYYKSTIYKYRMFCYNTFKQDVCRESAKRQCKNLYPVRVLPR